MYTLFVIHRCSAGNMPALCHRQRWHNQTSKMRSISAVCGCTIGVDRVTHSPLLRRTFFWYFQSIHAPCLPLVAHAERSSFSGSASSLWPLRHTPRASSLLGSALQIPTLESPVCCTAALARQVLHGEQGG